MKLKDSKSLYSGPKRQYLELQKNFLETRKQDWNILTLGFLCIRTVVYGFSTVTVSFLTVVSGSLKEKRLNFMPGAEWIE